MSFSVETKEYTERVSNALKNSKFSGLEDVVKVLLEARNNKHWIFIAGNGGSASNASHFANDMVKGLSVEGKIRFRAKALCDATPIMTALANDYSYEQVYEEQLKNFASSGDILIVISGSGNSPNVLRAAKYAREAGLTVIAFTGRDGGKIKEYSDICCIAATDSMEEIEDVHMVWEHSIVTALRSAI